MYSEFIYSYILLYTLTGGPRVAHHYDKVTWRYEPKFSLSQWSLLTLRNVYNVNEIPEVPGFQCIIHHCACRFI